MAHNSCEVKGLGETELHYAAARTSWGAWSPGTARTRFRREDSVAATAAVNLSDSRYGILSSTVLLVPYLLIYTTEV